MSCQRLDLQARSRSTSSRGDRKWGMAPLLDLDRLLLSGSASSVSPHREILKGFWRAAFGWAFGGFGAVRESERSLRRTFGNVVEIDLLHQKVQM